MHTVQTHDRKLIRAIIKMQIPRSVHCHNNNYRKIANECTKSLIMVII